MRRRLCALGLVFCLVLQFAACSSSVTVLQQSDNEEQITTTQTKTTTTMKKECVHSWNEATCTEAKECTKCGKTQGSALGHNFSNATCKAPKTCNRCGKTEGSKSDHKYELGNDAADVCKTCGNKNFTTYSANAVRFLLEMLKNPSSLQIYSIYAGYYDREYSEYDEGHYLAVIIDCTAENGFGGSVREDFICLFDYKSGTGIIDLNGEGEDLRENGFGKNKLYGIDLCKEASSLSAVKKSKFQKQDHEKCLVYGKEWAEY